MRSNEDQVALIEAEQEQYALDNGLDPVLFKLIMRVRGSILAHMIIHGKQPKKENIDE